MILLSTHPVFAPGFEASFVDRLLKEVPEGMARSYRDLGPVELIMAPELGRLRDILKTAMPVAAERLLQWLEDNMPEAEE